MLRGSKVGLRARHEDDIPILQTELHDDVVNHSRSDGRPWRPISPGSAGSPFVVDDQEERSIPFSVVELDGGALVGTATRCCAPPSATASSARACCAPPPG